MVMLDLFSGIGGFSLGFQQAGWKFDKHYFSEVDKHAIAIYKHNFKEAEYVGAVGDVSGIKADVITFGSPCQDFSLAGKRLGMDGERSSLITEAIRVVDESRPGVFIWENVKGAFSSNDGADFWAIIKAFTDLGGYRLEWQLLNTSWFLPQNRERIYLIGHLGEGSGAQVFPIGESDTGINEGANETTNIRTFTAGGHSGGNHSGMTLLRWQNKDAGIVEDELAPTLRSSGGAGIRKRPAVLQRGRGFNEGGEHENCPTISSNSFEHNNHVKHQQDRIKSEDGIMSTLPDGTHGNASSYTKTKVGDSIRRLTEIECERLQGFPDNWTKFGNYDRGVKEVSSTQRYKCCGNAVTVDVVQEIAKRLL